MMKILVGFGGNPNATDTEKWTPLVSLCVLVNPHFVDNNCFLSSYHGFILGHEI